MDRRTLQHAATTRPALALVVALFWVVAYTIVGRRVDPGDAHVLRLAWDDAIPFWPASVYLYSWAYTSSIYPLFVVRSPGLFRRVAAAYVAVTVVSMLCFWLYPVTAAGFRPDPSTLDASVFHEWGVRVTYAADPPYNLFPSMHLAFATLAALSAYSARPLFGVLAAPMVAAIAVSICTMKQHYLVDGLAAFVVAFLAWMLLVRTWRPGSGEAGRPRAFSWHGPVGYVAFHAAVYLGFYVAFRLGVGSS